MKAVLYCRVSTSEQDISIENQEEKMRAYCFSKDIEIQKCYVDFGQSAATIKREALQELIVDIKCNLLTNHLVLVYKLDRLSRSIKDLIFLVELFNNHDVHFASMSDSFDTSTANGRLVLHILASVAQWERDIISERTKDALRFLKASSRVYGNIAYGFKKTENLITVDSAEKEIINMIISKRNANLSYYEIAKIFNEQEIPTKTSGKWYATTVKRIYEREKK